MFVPIDLNDKSPVRQSIQIRTNLRGVFKGGLDILPNGSPIRFGLSLALVPSKLLIARMCFFEFGHKIKDKSHHLGVSIEKRMRTSIGSSSAFRSAVYPKVFLECSTNSGIGFLLWLFDLYSSASALRSAVGFFECSSRT